MEDLFQSTVVYVQAFLLLSSSFFSGMSFVLIS